MTFLRAFTARGRVFLCVGAVIVAGALAVGERDLVRVGVLVTVLPLLSALSVLGAPRLVTHDRELTPARVPVGGDARVVIRVANTGSVLPASGVLVDDALPHTLGGPPRFALGRLRRGETRELRYRVRSQVRGRFPVGPLTLTFRDPLGCAQVERRLGSGVSLLVTPTVVALDGLPRGGSADEGSSRTPSMARSGEDDTLPREFRHGDDLRRVHWRSTARHGELMVRREERRWREHSSVLLDVRACAHGGGGPDSSLETAVSAAASVAVHLLGTGQELRLLAGETEVGAVGRAEGVLDALAVVRPVPSPTLHGAVERLCRASASGRGVVVAVLGALQAAEADALAEVGRADARTRVAVLCRPTVWPAPASARQARDRLAGAGWLVVEIDSVEDLAAAWRERAKRWAGTE
ncbi:DUF58 domain-containing protein, partial [Marinitenerispora sediminis]|uniref:DUF58 domain-containing protein n=1 Tax=Marinitenerispora sediminis TaxID=1931232 RepID=UPI000DF1FF59